MRVAKLVFWHQSVPALVAGLAFALLGAFVLESRPLSGSMLLLFAPIAAFAIGLLAPLS